MAMQAALALLQHVQPSAWVTRVARVHSQHGALAKLAAPLELPWLVVAMQVAWAISSERAVASRMSSLATEGVCVFSVHVQKLD